MDGLELTDYYNKHAERLAEQYQSLNFASVHDGWVSILKNEFPHAGLRIMDVGAGSGRDAAFLATERSGNRVFAVEPAKGLAAFGQEFTKGLNVEWSNAALPQLVGIDDKFQLILLSAVWMHLAPSDRLPALTRLAELLAKNGVIVISLRLTISEDDKLNRQMFDVDPLELEMLAAKVGLVCLEKSVADTDKLGRDIQWQTVILKHANCLPVKLEGV